MECDKPSVNLKIRHQRCSGGTGKALSLTFTEHKRSREFIHWCLFFKGVHEIAALSSFGYFSLTAKEK
jgi:hypothetical protein